MVDIEGELGAVLCVCRLLCVLQRWCRMSIVRCTCCIRRGYVLVCSFQGFSLDGFNVAVFSFRECDNLWFGKKVSMVCRSMMVVCMSRVLKVSVRMFWCV